MKKGLFFLVCLIAIPLIAQLTTGNGPYFQGGGGSGGSGTISNQTSTVAGTANQIASSVGTAQPLSGSPATTLSLPDPVIVPGKVSGNIITNRDFAAIGIVTNDANGKLYTTPTLPNALLANSSATIAGTANQVSVSGGGPLSLGGTATLSIPNTFVAPGSVTATTGFTGGGHNITNTPFFFTLQNYMILGTAVSANQTNFFALHSTTSKSTAEASAKELYLVNGVNGNGAWVSNFWVYFNSTISTSTNLFFYVITNGVATAMGMNFTGNGSANRYVSDSSHPFFLGDGYDWSIGMTNNNNLPASLVFSWGLVVYPQ